MPYSFRDFQAKLLALLRSHVPDRETRIVDIGAGDGWLGNVIRAEYPNTDAVEICEAYVERFSLQARYRRVMAIPAQFFPTKEIAGTVFILGDVLEHLNICEAQQLLARLTGNGARLVIVIVPWMYEQGFDHPDVIASGNPYEVHQQPDLTEVVFESRYPGLSLVTKNYRCGMYIWDGRPISDRH